MAFVLDASIALAWAFPDEQSDVADTALKLLRTEQGLVPALWWFEVCNALIAGERRARIDRANTAAFLARVAQLPIQTDRTPNEMAVLDAARRHRLTVYDAACFELAVRRGVELATLDKHLLAAAVADGVPLVTP